MSNTVTSTSTKPSGLMGSIQTRSGAKHIVLAAMITFILCVFTSHANQDQVAARGFSLCAIMVTFLYVVLWLPMIDRMDETATQECLSHPWGSEAKAFLLEQFKKRHFLREWDFERADNMDKKETARALKEDKGDREKRARLENQKMLDLWKTEQRN
jgi:hypothetical protein